MFIKKSLMATIALLLLLVSCSSSKGTESVDVHEEASIPETPVETVSPYDVYEECYYDVQFKTHMYWLFDHDTNTGMFVSRSMRKNKAGKRVVRHEAFEYEEDDEHIITINFCDGDVELYIRKGAKGKGEYLYGYSRENGLDTYTCLLSQSCGEAIEILQSVKVPFKFGCD